MAQARRVAAVKADDIVGEESLSNKETCSLANRWIKIQSANGDLVRSQLLTMCRVCLAVDVCLHSLLQPPLHQMFEKITDIPVHPDDKKSLLVCYICKKLLMNCYNLSTRAQKADHILTQYLKSDTKLTTNLNANFVITSIENYFVTIPLEEEQSNEVKTSVVKHEQIKCEFNEEDIKTCQTVDNYDGNDTDHHTVPHPESDSDDDVPLQALSAQNKKVTKRKKYTFSTWKKSEWLKKRNVKGFSADFAKEIILSKEQQLKELLDRAQSLNYLNSPYKCELCYKGFVDTRAYDNHREKHDERSGPHECEICRMRYSTQRQLRTHTHTSHSRRYQCAKCAHQSHTANQAREHDKWHSGYTYECKLCGQKFRKPTSYLTHKRKRHPTHHICDVCGGSFVGRHGLLMHRSKAHTHHKSPERPTEPSNERFCTDCNIQFASKEAWTRHVLTSHDNVHSQQCKVCDSWLPSAGAAALHRRAHERALRAAPPAHPHARTDTPAHTLACAQCDSQFVNRSKLQAHIKRKHLGLKYNKNIVCEVCGKKCTSNASLRYHQRTHTGEKPYQCGECSKRFADNNQLRIHTRTHTGERPYCCAVCGKRFSQKPALNRHYRVHTGAKPYICQFCSKPFSQSNSLKLHVRTVHLKMPPNRKNKQVDEQNAQKTEEGTLQSVQ